MNKIKLKKARRLANLWKIYTNLEKYDKMLMKWRRING